MTAINDPRAEANLLILEVGNELALGRDVQGEFIDDLANKIASLKLLSRQIMAGLEDF